MSNQVYRNLNKAKPYSGEGFGTVVAMAGNPGGVVGSCSIRLWRTTPNSCQFSIDATSPAIVWGGATQIDSAVGAIPLGYRPAIEQVVPAMLVTTLVTIPPHAVFCAYIRIRVDGSFSVYKYNGQDGTVVQWATNDQVGNCTISYFIGSLITDMSSD